MSYIHLTPEEVDLFAGVLERFATELFESKNSLNNSLSQLGGTWKDPTFSDFETEFEKTRANIDNFVKIADEHIGYLRRKAEAARQARDQR